MTSDLLERTVFTIKKVLKEADLTWEDVPRILLVGGSTRMPRVAARLDREFATEIDRTLAPDEAVAHGAALYAEFLQARGGAGTARMSIRNVNSHDLGVLAIEDATNQPRRKIQIPRNTPLPATGTGRFHTRHDDQRHVGVPVIEGGDASGRNATHIGQCAITDLPPGLPSGTPIDIAFTYAEDGRLTVQAELPTVNRRATLTIERASGLSAEVLHRWEERIASGSLPGMEPAEEGQTTDGRAPESGEPEPEKFRVCCPNGHDLSCSLSLQGKAGRCPKCGARFFIPVVKAGEPQSAEKGEEPEAEAGGPAGGDPELDDFLKGLGQGQ